MDLPWQECVCVLPSGINMIEKDNMDTIDGNLYRLTRRRDVSARPRPRMR